ncbi:MAG: GTP-binding protein [Thermoprotei archaeon]|nr:MAG: GTP-binding protein [Thermoprotei archaeon]
MPANLPAEAKAKWAKVMEARTPSEKIKALEDFLSSVPKHKGTEKLVSQVRRQIAVLRRQIELEKKKKRGRRPGFFVEKEGDAQIVILGLTKSGKSTLLKKLTNAKVVVSDAPFQTKRPVPGMMIYKGVEFQLVEAPAVIEGASSGVGWGLQTLALARNAEGLILLIDAQGDLRYQYNVLVGELERARIHVKKPRVLVKVERRSQGGVIVLGKLRNCTVRDIEKMLRSYRIYHALVRIDGEAELSDIEDSLFENVVYKPALFVINKIDAVTDKDALENFKKFLEDQGLAYIEISAKNGVNTSPEIIGGKLFELLNLMRIYTRKPGRKEIAEKPVVVKKGATVLDIAKLIHSQLYKNFKYARVWSSRLKFSPQRVGADFVLEDGDIVEIVAS